MCVVKALVLSAQSSQRPTAKPGKASSHHVQRKHQGTSKNHTPPGGRVRDTRLRDARGRVAHPLRQVPQRLRLQLAGIQLTREQVGRVCGVRLQQRIRDLYVHRHPTETTRPSPSPLSAHRAPRMHPRTAPPRTKTGKAGDAPAPPTPAPACPRVPAPLARALPGNAPLLCGPAPPPPRARRGGPSPAAERRSVRSRGVTGPPAGWGPP